jgi:hypothetical protein
VLELQDLEDRPVDVDVVPVAELVGIDNGRSALSEPNLNVFGCRSAHLATRSQ